MGNPPPYSQYQTNNQQYPQMMQNMGQNMGQNNMNQNMPQQFGKFYKFFTNLQYIDHYMEVALSLLFLLIQV